MLIRLTDIFLNSLSSSIKITFFVLIIMILAELLNIFTKNKAKSFILKHKNFQYGISSFLGATPGGFGAFLSVSFYTHGMISLGAIIGTMIATSGDESFVMLVKFPETALLLFSLLFIAGIIFGYLSNVIANKLGIKPCTECQLSVYHETQTELTIKHLLTKHIFNHILKKHTLRIFIWIFAVIFATAILNTKVDLKNFITNNRYLVMLLAVLVGIIPESGPNLLFVNLFAQGALPFSILFANSFVQDGHGMLPMLSYSLRDSIIIKTFNVVFAIILGYSLLLFGI